MNFVKNFPSKITWFATLESKHMYYDYSEATANSYASIIDQRLAN